MLGLRLPRSPRLPRAARTYGLAQSGGLASGNFFASVAESLSIVDSAFIDFFTNFPTVEDPLSQGGIWNTGLGTGLDWTNPKVTSNGCVASSVPTPNRYSDDIAHLKTSFRTFAARQFAQATVYKLAGYTGGGGAHEIELLLHFTISANNAQGFECSIGISATFTVYAFIVRWEGAAGVYTALADPSNGIGTYINTPTVPVSGDVVMAKWETGGVITLYQNGVPIISVTDATHFLTGQPGLGFWPVDGATTTSMGWSDYRAGDLA